MKKIATFIFIFLSSFFFGQEVLSFDEIYSENNLTYKLSNNELFTGKVQRFKKNNHLVFEIEFENGILKTSTLFYNGKEQVESDKKYFDENGKLVKKEKFSFDKKYIWTTLYNSKEEKILDEEHENGVLKYKCEYLNGKKHGIVYCLKDDGTTSENLYNNGKLIK